MTSGRLIKIHNLLIKNKKIINESHKNMKLLSMEKNERIITKQEQNQEQEGQQKQVGNMKNK